MQHLDFEANINLGVLAMIVRFLSIGYNHYDQEPGGRFATGCLSDARFYAIATITRMSDLSNDL